MSKVNNEFVGKCFRINHNTHICYHRIRPVKSGLPHIVGEETRIIVNAKDNKFFSLTCGMKFDDIDTRFACAEEITDAEFEEVMFEALHAAVHAELPGHCIVTPGSMDDLDSIDPDFYIPGPEEGDLAV